MKIGIDAFSLKGNRTGVGNYLYYNLKKIIEKSKDDDFYLFVKSDFEEFQNYKNVHYIKSKSKFKFMKGSVWLFFFAFIFKKYRFDVFWSPNFFTPLWIHKKTRVIVTIHDLSHMRYPEFLTRKALWSFKINLKRSLVRATKIIAVSQFTKNELSYFYPKIDDKKIVVNYNGIDLIDICYTDNESLLIKKKYGIEKKFILALSTLVERKNTICILRAFKEYINNHGELNLVLVGRKDKNVNELSKFILDNNLEDKVIITGFVLDSELQWFYKNCALYVNSSLYEGFGIPNLEAYRFVDKILLSDIPVYRELFGSLVQFFDPNNPKRLAELFKTNYTIKKDLDFVKKFEWEVIAEETYKILTH